MRFSLLLLIFFFAAGNAQAQRRGPLLQFLHDEWNFGKVSERTGILKHSFPFVNDGDAPLWLTKVEPSCACTSPEWSHDTIMPGDTGYVSAAYQTYARPGAFDKTIAIFANTPQGAIIIRVKGDVFLPYDESTEARNREWYGDLRLVEQTITSDPLYNDRSDTLSARFINHGNQTVQILEVVKLPHYVTLLNLPEAVEPGETAIFQVVMDGSKVGKWGWISDQINLFTDDPMQPYKQIFLTAQVKEYFPAAGNKKLLKQAPNIGIDRQDHAFGQHKEGAILHTSFTLRNTGKSPLIIRDMVTDCACVEVTPNKGTLAPGETLELKVKFDTVFRTGLQMRPVRIVSNDPDQSELTFYLKAQVLQ
jgi:hypothetical protein